MASRIIRQSILFVVVGVIVLTALPACQQPASEGGFDSADPASKLYAIRRADGPADADKIPNLIEQLNSDDPAVRMYAIVALERVTGTRLDFDPYAPAYERDAAVRNWVRAFEAGEIQALPTNQSDSNS